MRAPQGPWIARIFFGCLGALALALGIIGAFVPLLPTVPLVILAAACFAKSSARVETWLLAHPRFGPVIRDWRERGAISLKGKVAATIGVIVGFCLFYFGGDHPLWLIITVALVLLGCTAYVLSRPR